ncbi:hypothetical protein LXL04_014247 [Taraxacum kok-saghyz]
MEELVANLAHAMNVSIEFHLHFPRREGNKKQKTGCHCLMSHCMHKLCSCLKARVACSNICQCDGCRNVNGRKGDNSEVKSDAFLDLKL